MTQEKRIHTETQADSVPKIGDAGYFTTYMKQLLADAQELRAMKIEINGDYSADDLAVWDQRLNNSSALIAILPNISDQVEGAIDGLLNEIDGTKERERDLQSASTPGADQGDKRSQVATHERNTEDEIKVSRKVFKSLLDMANAHVDDIDSGILAGTLEADDNPDIEEKRQTVSAANNIAAIDRDALMPAAVAEPANVARRPMRP